MDALAVLRNQVGTVDNLIKQVFANVSPEQARWRLEGSTANPIASAYLHLYYVEDRVVHRYWGSPTVFESGGWRERLGYDPSIPWTNDLTVDPEACRAYAAAVLADTQRYLESIEPTALDEEIETSRGRQLRGNSLLFLLVTHKATHMGEIAALLGCQGVKGFPV